MEIIYYDKDIAVAVKPSGVISEGTTDDKRSMPGMIAAELEAMGVAVQNIYPVHRLDRETQGIMVYALTKSASAALSRSVAEHEITKKYIAVIHGRIKDDSAKLCDLLYYDRQRNKSFVVKRERRGVKAAELFYELLSYDSELDRSRLLITLATGRTHQIRVQFASRGFPLLGDRKYGAPAGDGKELALTSVYLSFPHPKSKKVMEFKLDGSF